MAFSLLTLGINPMIAAATGYSAGLVTNWLMSSRLVFKDFVAASAAGRLRQQVLFVLSAGIGLGITVAIVGVGVAFGLDPRAAKLVAVVISFFAIWLFRKKIVFARAGAPPDGSAASSSSYIRSQPAQSDKFWLRIFGNWLLICILLIGISSQSILAEGFPDPDDTLRLLQVRDLLNGQSWFDLHQYRIDPMDGGVLMHWSRLVDIPLAASILLLRPFLGQPLAEIVTMIAVPLMTLGIVLVLISHIAKTHFGKDVAIFSNFIMMMGYALIYQLSPMRIDHHGWQVVAALGGLAGYMMYREALGGWIAGISISLGLAISIEGMPLAAAFAAVAAVHWLWDGSRRIWLSQYMVALASSSAVIFALTHGTRDLVNHCDQMSPVHLGILGWGAMVIASLSLFGNLRRTWLLLGFVIAMTGAGLLVASSARQCLAGPFSDLDPVVHALWFDRIGEGLPLWRQTSDFTLQLLVPTSLALYACWRLAGQNSGPMKSLWLDYLFLTLASLILSVLVARASSVTTAFDTIPLAWLTFNWFRSYRGETGLLPRLSFLAAIAIAVLPTLPTSLFALIAPIPVPVINGVQLGPIANCNIAKGAKPLTELPSGAVLAPLDIGPEIALYTQDSILASGHHRGQTAMRQVMNAFIGENDKAALEVVERNKISYVALCPKLAELYFYLHETPHGFLSTLLNGGAPAWLQPLPTVEGSNLRVWKVREPGAGVKSG